MWHVLTSLSARMPKLREKYGPKAYLYRDISLIQWDEECEEWGKPESLGAFYVGTTAASAFHVALSDAHDEADRRNGDPVAPIPPPFRRKPGPTSQAWAYNHALRVAGGRMRPRAGGQRIPDGSALLLG